MRLPALAAALFLLAALALTACSTERHHPAGYAGSTVHPIDAKLATEDCRDCHGAQLDGGTAGVNCDDCHQTGWREDCLYCHGGEDSPDGAPPRDIDGTVAEDDTSFWPHTTHSIETDGPAYACVQCHKRPTNVLDEGHLWDGTPGVAEVDFSGGISPDAAWSATGCTNAYCHGTGQDEGDVELDGYGVNCGSCHPVAGASNQEIAQLSGEHREHVVHNVDCQECHPNTGDGADITDPGSHVDGEVTLQMPYGVTRTNGRCTGSCHNENHNNDSW